MDSISHDLMCPKILKGDRSRYTHLVEKKMQKTKLWECIKLCMSLFIYRFKFFELKMNKIYF